MISLKYYFPSLKLFWYFLYQISCSYCCPSCMSRNDLSSLSSSCYLSPVPKFLGVAWVSCSVLQKVLHQVIWKVSVVSQFPCLLLLELVLNQVLYQVLSFLHVILLTTFCSFNSTLLNPFSLILIISYYYHGVMCCFPESSYVPVTYPPCSGHPLCTSEWISFTESYFLYCTSYSIISCISYFLKKL